MMKVSNIIVGCQVAIESSSERQETFDICWRRRGGEEPLHRLRGHCDSSSLAFHQNQCNRFRLQLATRPFAHSKCNGYRHLVVSTTLVIGLHLVTRYRGVDQKSSPTLIFCRYLAYSASAVSPLPVRVVTYQRVLAQEVYNSYRSSQMSVAALQAAGLAETWLKHSWQL